MHARLVSRGSPAPRPMRWSGEVAAQAGRFSLADAEGWAYEVAGVRGRFRAKVASRPDHCVVG